MGWGLGGEASACYSSNVSFNAWEDVRFKLDDESVGRCWY